MRAVFKIFVVVLALALLGCVSATQNSSSAEVAVTERLAQYAELLRHQDAPALAAMFEPSGFMSHAGQAPVVGRAAIESFMASFASYEVLSQEMLVTSTLVEAGSATQAGTYAQAVITPEGTNVKVSGTFTAVWRQAKNGQWKLRSMHTESARGT